MHDVLVLVIARPRDVALPRGQRRAYRVHAGNELSIAAEGVHDCAAHASHDPHARGNVRTVGELYADVSDVASDRPHREGHDVERATAHAAVEEAAQRRPHLVGSDPVVRGARVLLTSAADERAILDASDVRRVRAGEIAPRALGRVEPDQCTGGDHRPAKTVVLLL